MQEGSLGKSPQVRDVWVTSANVSNTFEVPSTVRGAGWQADDGGAPAMSLSRASVD